MTPRLTPPAARGLPRPSRGASGDGQLPRPREATECLPPLPLSGAFLPNSAAVHVILQKYSLVRRISLQYRSGIVSVMVAALRRKRLFAVSSEERR